MLVRAYRKADKLRIDRINQVLWWQGAYTYQVMGEVSPLFRMSFSKKSIKAEPYLKEPFPIHGEVSRQKTEQDIENERLKATLFFKNWARANRNAGR